MSHKGTGTTKRQVIFDILKVHVLSIGDGRKWSYEKVLVVATSSRALPLSLHMPLSLPCPVLALAYLF